MKLSIDEKQNLEKILSETTPDDNTNDIRKYKNSIQIEKDIEVFTVMRNNRKDRGAIFIADAQIA
jgi:hypothetical protein